uniref:Uncharacterized protein n=1 Tax=Arundo donax TaxID=35708 RepID=A0A0A9BM53_ARUDO
MAFSNQMQEKECLHHIDSNWSVRPSIRPSIVFFSVSRIYTGR